MEAQTLPDQPPTSFILTTNNPDVIFRKEEEGILYFQASPSVVDQDEGLQSDAWKTFNNRYLQVLIENCLNDTLVVYPDLSENNAVFQPEIVQDSCQDNCKVKLHEYRDTNPREGVSIAFTVQKDSRTYIMHCTSDITLGFKEGSAPVDIPGNKSEYIFYKRYFSEGDVEAFTFESSLLDGYFLASNEEKGLKKLALKRSQDQVDESIRMRVLSD